MPIRHHIRAEVREIIGQLVDDGFEAYIVGGAVRDLLLGLAPKDYDIATGATPEEVRRVFGRRRSRIIGRRFRLVHVYANQEIYEVSTFRREPTPDERSQRDDDDGMMIWRDNEYGTLEQDANRRDFTVNALYYDPVGDRGIIDFVGGIRDLEERRVRAIGDPAVRMDEDPVRILRALKLVGQHDFTLEPALDQVVRERAGRICLASRSRLFEELLKILSGSRSLPILAAFRRYGLLEHFWPALDAIWDTPAGHHTQNLLAERDRRMQSGEYSTSKALALSTVSLPYVAKALESAGLPALWTPGDAVEHHCRGAVQEFFDPLPLPRFFMARVRDILLLLPRFAHRVHPGRLQRHQEYKYGRELYGMLLAVCGLSPDLLADWPVVERPPQARGSRPRRRAPRGRTQPTATDQGGS